MTSSDRVSGRPEWDSGTNSYTSNLNPDSFSQPSWMTPSCTMSGLEKSAGMKVGLLFVLERSAGVALAGVAPAIGVPRTGSTAFALGRSVFCCLHPDNTRARKTIPSVRGLGAQTLKVALHAQART